MDLVALVPFKYNTRRLMAGDTFAANNRDARLLIAIKRAREGRAIGKLAPPPKTLVAKVAKPKAKPDELSALREQYTAKVGKRPFHGWDAATLKEKIAADKS